MMFIKVISGQPASVLINVSEISKVYPLDCGLLCQIITKDQKRYTIGGDIDTVRDFLIDCAAQTTAPIASRVMGLDNTIARLCRSVEDMLEKLNTPIVMDYSEEEAAHIKRTLEGTRRTLDSIQPRLQPAPAHHVGLDSDVYAVVTMLNNGEYGEHWAGTELGGRLESEITKLVGSENEKANKLRRAEELLVEVWHEWNNDDATRKALGDDMGNVIGNFLYPDSTNC